MTFRNRSVRRTLRVIVMFTSTIALVLACVAFVAVDLVGSGRTLRSDLEILTDIIGANSAASLMFGDPEAAKAVLSALRARPAIVAGCIYMKDGRVFVPYASDGSALVPPPHAPAVGSRFTGRAIEVARPIVFQGEVIGTLFIASDLRELTARIRQYAVAAVLILLVALLLAFVVSQPLQKILADPILDLASVAGRVRSAKDYSVRADPIHGAPREIAELISAFNEMLGGIQTRDRELEERRANLELQVADRTAELRRANASLMRARDDAQQIADANEAVLNTAAEGIFGLDDRGVATFINRSAATMLGTTVAALIGRPLHEIIHDDELAALPLERCPVCRPGPQPARRSGGISLVSAAGKRFPIEYTASAMREDDQGGGAVVTFRDITERLAVERMKDEFISTVSHELRTPLTSIRGALGLLGSGLLGDVDARAGRMLEIALTNTDRLVRLINDILDLEKISSGRVELHRAAVSASALVRDAVDVVQNVADRAGISIVCDDVDAAVMVDRDRIVQTLTNLLSNAVKFSSAGGVVRVGGVAEGDAFTFFVTDQGRGIPREKLEMVFERFKQVNASDSRDKGGTGLGLAICRSIVNAHGGRIWAENNEPRGSTLRFTVPRVCDPPATFPGSRYVLLCGGPPSGGELAEAIRASGYEWVSMSSLDEAPKHPGAAAVILDLTETGEHVCRVLDSASSTPLALGVPLIVASADPAAFFDSNAANVAAWLRAPFTPTDVAAVLAAAAGLQPVLIVEDDLDLSRVIAASLSNQGLRPMCVATGSEAIAACSAVEPALLVLDLGLPDIDGFGVVRWMREQPHLRDVPLLVYTARDVSTADQGRLRLGETEFLTKSRVPLNVLAQRVRALLHAHAPEEMSGAA